MTRNEYRTFLDARAFVRTLGLLDFAEWNAYTLGELDGLFGTIPRDIPKEPARVYRGVGWAGTRDWLGPPPVAPAQPGFMNYKAARRFARSLGLSSAREWQRWCSGRCTGKPPRPSNVPADPMDTYPRAWRGWADWLGRPRGAPRSGRLLPYDRARAFARSLRLGSREAWCAYCKGRFDWLPERPRGIPANPAHAYACRGWKGYGDWLGTGRASPRDVPFVPLAAAGALARSLGLRTIGEYRLWAAGHRPDLPPRPAEVPSAPSRSYRDAGWTTWGDFLGTGTVSPSKRRWKPYVTARAYARRLRLRNGAEWIAFRRGERPALGPVPEDIPARPEYAYAGRGWLGWGDFLGTGNRAATDRAWRSFESARSFARVLGLRTSVEWMAFARRRGGGRPDDVPRSPQHVYADRGWRGWGDFLGTGNRGPSEWNWRPFPEAREFARGLGFASRTEWGLLVKGAVPHLGGFPADLPRKPDRVYADQGWRGWRDFLGNEARPPRRRTWRPFEEARTWARASGLSSGRDWPKLVREHRPPGIPIVPAKVYAESGWRGWRDFLGTERPAWRPFTAARAFVRALGLSTYAEWRVYARGDRPDLGSRPRDVPAAAPHVYAAQWRGWRDFVHG